MFTVFYWNSEWELLLCTIKDRNKTSHFFINTSAVSDMLDLIFLHLPSQCTLHTPTPHLIYIFFLHWNSSPNQKFINKCKSILLRFVLTQASRSEISLWTIPISFKFIPLEHWGGEPGTLWNRRDFHSRREKKWALKGGGKVVCRLGSRI